MYIDDQEDEMSWYGDLAKRKAFEKNYNALVKKNAINGKYSIFYVKREWLIEEYLNGATRKIKKINIKTHHVMVRHFTLKN